VWFQQQLINQTPVQERPFNMVFQRYALFPHLNVEENLKFGLAIKGLSKNEIDHRVAEILKIIDLKSFRSRLPETLSGGQQQRVAVARALVNQPKVLLLDEPFSALDKHMREALRDELKMIQRKLGLSFVFVTHDQEEAFELSDRVCIMNNGRVEQIAAPEALYEEPNNLFIASFLGQMNTLKVNRLDENHVQTLDGIKIQMRNSMSASDSMNLCVRPEKIEVCDLSSKRTLSCTFELMKFKGEVFEYHFKFGESRFKVKSQKRMNLSIGQECGIWWREEDAHLLL
jgi:spermidine/putrescine transport system ATP-binding protein